MFSGIIEQTATLNQIEPRDSGVVLRLVFNEGQSFSPTLGESIACDGVCLTVTKFDSRSLEFFLSDETLDRSYFRQLKLGDKINLERSLKFGDRMSGHWVQGHVDGVGRVSAITPMGETTDIRVELPNSLVRYCVEKGSIAVQGVSLTVNSVSGSQISLRIIPHTWSVTSLSSLGVGSLVNIEVDVLAKYVEKLIPRGAIHEENI